MPQPTPGDRHVNRPLTNLSVALMNEMTDYVADVASPIIPSDKQTNVFYTYTKDFWFRDQLQVRGPGAEAEELGYGMSTDSYAIVVWAGKQPVDDQTRSNEDSEVLNADQDAMEYVTQLERIRREKSFASTYLAASTWTTDWDGAASDTPGADEVEQWDRTGSLPIQNIRAAATEVHLLTGKRPNHLAMGREVWDELADHADVIDRVKAGGAPGAPAPTIVTQQAVAQLMELEALHVMQSVENTAAEGATFAGSYIAGKDALLYYLPRSPGRKVASALYTFTWQQYAAAANGTRIKKYRVEQNAADFVEIESAFVHKIISADLGAFIDGVVG